MKVVSNSVNKVVVELTWGRVSSSELFYILVPGITKESFLLILCQQSRNLTSREDHTDVFKKFFVLDFRVSENEAAVFAKTTSNFDVFLDIFFVRPDAGW